MLSEGFLSLLPDSGRRLVASIEPLEGATAFFSGAAAGNFDRVTNTVSSRMLCPRNAIAL
jgi:hypothetical protein